MPCELFRHRDRRRDGSSDLRNRNADTEYRSSENAPCVHKITGPIGACHIAANDFSRTEGSMNEMIGTDIDAGMIHIGIGITPEKHEISGTQVADACDISPSADRGKTARTVTARMDAAGFQAEIYKPGAVKGIGAFFRPLIRLVHLRFNDGNKTFSAVACGIAPVNGRGGRGCSRFF